MKSPAQPASTLAQNSQPWPAQIDRYRVRGILGTGGMGEVYRAYDPQLDRLVASNFCCFTARTLA